MNTDLEGEFLTERFNLVNFMNRTRRKLFSTQNLIERLNEIHRARVISHAITSVFICVHPWFQTAQS
jgi:hypothetical protein